MHESGRTLLEQSLQPAPNIHRGGYICVYLALHSGLSNRKLRLLFLGHGAYFDSDKSLIRERLWTFIKKAQKNIKACAFLMNARPAYRALVRGHADFQ